MYIGDVEVIPLVEFERWGAGPAEAFFPGVDPSPVEAERSWMEPDHVDPDGSLPTALQAFLVRTPKTTVLVDTNLGDGGGARHEGVFGELLERMHVDPASIDLVVNTHMHGDHAGGNTVLDEQSGRYIPRFPTAQYLIGADDIDYWRPSTGTYPDSRAMNAEWYVRSIQPLLDADVVTPWTGTHVIDDWLTLRAASGHTPGAAVLELESEGEIAVFVGDMIHHAIQLKRPDWVPIVDEDGVLASAARIEVLGWAADNDVIVIPGHFPGAHGLRVQRDGDVFALKEWVEVR